MNHIKIFLIEKKTTTNPVNNDDKCFQYAATVKLNHEKIGKSPQRLSKIKSFIKNITGKE